jgi:hypothetical protein
MICLGSRGRYFWAGLAVAAALLPAVGCKELGETVAIMIKGTDIDPEFPGLNGKQVAVVCRSLTDLKYQDSRVAKDLARTIAGLLQQNGSKIKLVSMRKVERWTDEHNWENFTEVGKAVGADMLVGVDLEHFDMYSGQTLYQGKASLTVHVYNLKPDPKAKAKDKDKDEKSPEDPVFEKSLSQVVWPANNCIPTSEKPEGQFRREFIEVIAKKVGFCFYPRPMEDGYADDPGM